MQQSETRQLTPLPSFLFSCLHVFLLKKIRSFRYCPPQEFRQKFFLPSPFVFFVIFCGQ
jgi:hypothetical protein